MPFFFVIPKLRRDQLFNLWGYMFSPEPDFFPRETKIR